MKVIKSPFEFIITFSVLREIAKKIDVNNDQKINAQELENWISGNMKRYSLKNTNDKMKKWDTDKDEKISWTEYVANFDAAGNTAQRKEQLRTDERRFNVSLLQLDIPLDYIVYWAR